MVIRATNPRQILPPGGLSPPPNENLITQEEHYVTKLTWLARCTAIGVAVVFGLAAWAADPHNPGQAPPPAPSFQIYAGFFNAQAVKTFSPGYSGTGKTLLDGLTNITGGIAVDNRQNVYVTTGPGWVLMYPPTGVVPMLRYQFPDFHQPNLTAGITVDQAGTLYATLVGDNGIVAEYPAGDTTKASFTISPPPPYTAFAVAVDRQNNLYIQYAFNGPFPQTAYIEKCLPQSKQCTDLGIQLGAGGFNLIVDSQGNVIACDLLAKQIDIFPPNSGQPRVISQGLTGCAYFALDSTETYLVVGNQPRDGGDTSLSIFDYATGELVQNITSGVPQGDLLSGLALAVSPTAAH
jgi:hypothetical protein